MTPKEGSLTHQKRQLQIGKFIATLREKRGITQQELAGTLQTSQSAIARMEKGEQNFSTEMLAKISDALDKDIVTLSTPAMNFQIEGGYKLSGTITTNTSKNSAVHLICASLLNTNKTILKNVPHIEEVNRMIEVFSSLDIDMKWRKNDLEITPPKAFHLENINKESAMKTRTVVMMIGPLVHFFKEFSLPQPGGCKLGARSVRPHLYALEKFGINITSEKNLHHISHHGLHASDVVLYESGDTVTVNALFAAAKIPGKTTIKFASANYQIQDVCYYLEKLGVKIEGIGTTTLTVHGVKTINKPVEYYLSEDPIESMFFLAAAIITQSSITIERCPIDFLELELLKLEKMGFEYKILKKYKARNGFTHLVDIQTFPSKLRALDEKIYARPFPGLNIDNLPFFVPIATQADGQTLIHDWVYENRALYYLELTKLGAQIIFADPHRVYIKGPTPLKSADIICPPALRPAAIILIAMLASKGTSILRNVYSINRGYEDLYKRLNSLGAHIKMLRSF